ncbi:hypothetical protein DPMN_073068 [Dreissena polymorpha]|uniref:Uncharacterized protein n=1 Tax=Dreissena polymorpha TaxID=45954 RepID=A0A9D4HDD0_DREPO|nr:hypothetical protein DPMN_073068 [Dreissena polymorpha]
MMQILAQHANLENTAMFVSCTVNLSVMAHVISQPVIAYHALPSVKHVTVRLRNATDVYQDIMEKNANINALCSV